MNAPGRGFPIHRILSRPAFQAGFVALILGVLAQVWSHRTNAVFAFWDAQAHLDIARRVIDSTTPGLQMLGTVWLPVPHLLIMPLTLVDSWWWNGLAGGLIGLLAFTVTVAALHDLLTRRIGDPALAWLGTAILVLNPSLLYLQTTAMTEPLLLAFITCAVAGIDRWHASGSRRTLLLAGVAAALAVGSRYDGWFFVIVATPVVAWLAFRKKSGWFRDALIFAGPSALVVGLWLGYNQVFFGDALEFQRGVWSAQAQQAQLASAGLLPTKGHPLLAFMHYAGAISLSCGIVVSVVAPLAVLLIFRSAGAPVVLLLMAALPFNVLALWGGQSAINLPWTVPAGVLNVRYGVMMLPGLAAAVALAAAALARRGPGWRRGTLLATCGLILLQGSIFGVRWPANAGALREGLAIRDGDPRQQRASDWLARHYDGGRVLVAQTVNISPRTRIALRDRIYFWTWQLGAAALAAPERDVDWVVLDRRVPTDLVVLAVTGREAFTNRFDQTFSDEGVEIWRRR